MAILPSMEVVKHVSRIRGGEVVMAGLLGHSSKAVSPAGPLAHACTGLNHCNLVLEKQDEDAGAAEGCRKSLLGADG
ncbi:hypothetical protein P3T16_006568 [Paraburkholderia sp. GAS42]